MAEEKKDERLNNLWYRCFLVWPEKFAIHFKWLPPLLARFIVGWIFMWRGWSDLHHLHQVTADFTIMELPFARQLAPLMCALEVAGGFFVLLGFVTRVSAVALATALVLGLARNNIHSVHSLVTLKESHYIALFLWLAVVGAGLISVDSWVQRPKPKPPAKPK